MRFSLCTTQVALNWALFRFFEVPRGITYCYSSAKSLDIVENILSAPERHPLVHTVCVHVGTNDTKLRQSIKLQEDLELLAITIESPGKHCVFPGLTPTLRKGCELFSRLCGVCALPLIKALFIILILFWLDLMSPGEITHTLIVGGHASLKQGSPSTD